jgi:hypothetical protein
MSLAPNILSTLRAEAPCDRCEMHSRRGEQLLACEAFHAYVNEKPWQAEGRTPTRARFAAIYSRQEEHEPQRGLAKVVRSRHRPRKVRVARPPARELAAAVL